ncbi:BTB/POZ domain-containing protein 3-like [Paramacrobiotus metropolitanus]|uniref:BTB/POZ domain-containing protein 3-like n=1 Tax=Paramacrobiotus metropolitanus TaxID=2943436 RepID=UPI002445AC1A|nr:BTB/POZ domain-containing protein 3-like [Paramacrobiotus metropolitanus]
MSVRSTVFDTLYYGSVPENCTAPIDIPDVLPEAFANMLSYMYTDEVTNLTLDNVFDTLKCADKYDLPLLLAMCTDFILSKLNITNCLHILDNVVNYGDAAPSIVEKCFCLIDESALTIWQSDQFCTIIRLWAVNTCNQKNIDTSSGNRREVLGRALFLVRFPLLTDAQLLDGPARTGLLLPSEVLDIYHYKHAAIKPQLPFRTESRQNERAEGVLNYTVPDVRELLKTPPFSRLRLFSESITVRKLLWSIDGEVEKKTDDQSVTLGFFLRYSGSTTSASLKCQVNAEFRLLPWKTETAPISKQTSHLFDQADCAWGYWAYISMEELMDPAKGYVNRNDFSLKLQIKLAADIPAGIECMHRACGCTSMKNSHAR